VLSPRALFLLALLTLCWGINWPMMKFSLRELSPLYFRATAMSAGALGLLAWYSAKGVAMRLPRASWWPVLLLAAPNILGWHLFSILGVQELASGRAAILGFTMPIWTVVLGALWFGQPLTRRAALAVACAGAAVALLVGHEITAIAGRPVGIVWMQVAAVCWALGTLLIRRSKLTLPTEALTVWMMLMSSVAFWALALALEPWPTWQFSRPMVWSLLWAAFINYGAAQVIWVGMARTLPPAASTFAIMAVPLVGIGAAALLVGEVPRLLDYVAAAFVVVAIAVSVGWGKRT
jgi:drug/metabolite transporter (DMT)-like permease